MQATDLLMEEHRLIERVLDAVETAANRLSAGQVMPMDFFLEAADFLKGFADGCHHAKEEGILFVAMSANGVLEPLPMFVNEHEQGRRLIRAMREAAARVQEGDTTAGVQIVQSALDYVALLREHIQKEDHMLFPMAEDVIPVEQHEQLTAEFDRLEREETAEGIHAKYLHMAEQLERISGSQLP